MQTVYVTANVHVQVELNRALPKVLCKYLAIGKNYSERRSRERIEKSLNKIEEETANRRVELGYTRV